MNFIVIYRWEFGIAKQRFSCNGWHVVHTILRSLLEPNNEILLVVKDEFENPALPSVENFIKDFKL